jgi:hypothetical protein
VALRYLIDLISLLLPGLSRNHMPHVKLEVKYVSLLEEIGLWPVLSEEPDEERGDDDV